MNTYPEVSRKSVMSPDTAECHYKMYLRPCTRTLSIFILSHWIIKNPSGIFLEDLSHISTYSICSHLEYFSRIWFLGFCCLLFLVLLLKTAWRLWSSATCCPILMSGFYRIILLLCTKALNIVMECNNTFYG